MSAFAMLGISMAAAVVYIVCMSCWPGRTTAAVAIPLIGLMIYAWWVDSARTDVPPPREMMKAIGDQSQGDEESEQEASQSPQISI